MLKQLKGKIFFGFLVGIIVFFASCGGGGGSDGGTPNASAANAATVVYKDGDMINDDLVLPMFETSVSEAAAAVVQAILAVNAVYPGGEDLSLADFRKKYGEAKHALEILESSAETTDWYLDLFPDEKSAAEYRTKIDPNEVEAILNSSKSKSVLKPLMAHYKVNARKALEILQNAEEGIYTDYTDRAKRADNIINVLKVVRDTSGLTVTIGAAVLTAGGSAAVMGGAAEMTLGESVGVIVQGSNAIVKLTKSSVELAIGKDGALDDDYRNSIALRTLAAADDIVSIVSIKSLAESGGWDTTQEAVSDLVFISGKARDLVQDKKLTFGAESIDVSDIVNDDIRGLKNAFEDPFPMVYDTPDFGLFRHGYSEFFKNIFVHLPEDMQTKSTSDLIWGILEHGDTSSSDIIIDPGHSSVSSPASESSSSSGAFNSSSYSSSGTGLAATCPVTRDASLPFDEESALTVVTYHDDGHGDYVLCKYYHNIANHPEYEDILAYELEKRNFKNYFLKCFNPDGCMSCITDFSNNEEGEIISYDCP